MWRTIAIFCSLLTLSLLCTCGSAQTDATGGSEGGSNHLAGQKSPYLLQHANNPVDWYPWGEPALEKAAREDKLLVISVGYAACHWCHVMEHESFEDSLVASIMNRDFVSIKVDREERPDVDEVYMTACQLTADQGCGWPLNVIALPDGKPVWAGTYFPKKQWIRILEQFSELRLSDPGKMEEYARGLTDELVRRNVFEVGNEDSSPLDREGTGRLADQLLSTIDFERGGTLGAPKFPMPILYEYLLTHHAHYGGKSSLEAVVKTLDAMADGGIYDQLAGGFSRYSTDEDWLVPHFEKMLYDNGQLLSLYAHAFQVTKKPRYEKIVRQTAGFLENYLSDESGLFYASLDADTEGEEGLTYVWTADEIDAIIQDERLSARFKDYYGVTRQGNWEGRSILFRSGSPERIVDKRGYKDLAALESAMSEAAELLLAERNLRPQPGLDDKALTAWNALAISGLADAHRALGDEIYKNRAVKAAEFIASNIQQSDGRLDRNWKDGNSAINAFLDDYALLAQAYLDLYEITFDENWMELTKNLVAYVDNHFTDGAGPMYSYTSDLDPPLVTGNVPVTDQVIPSGNSAMARVLHRLGILTTESKYVERAENMLSLVLPSLSDSGPRFYANWARLYIELLEPTYEVAIVGADAGAMRMELSRNFLPNIQLLGGASEGNLELLSNKLIPGETTIYVCLEKVCQLPMNEVATALTQIERN